MHETLDPNLLPALRLGAPHGLKGQLRAKLLLAQPQLLIGLTLTSQQTDGAAGPAVTLLTLKPQSGGDALVTVVGVADRTTAEQLGGLTLLLPRDQLPVAGDEEVYLGDLLQREVVGAEGQKIGRVSALRTAAGQDLLEISLFAGKPVLVPAHADFFADLQAAVLVLSELGLQLVEL